MEPLFNLLLFGIDGMALVSTARLGHWRGTAAGVALTLFGGSLLGALLGTDPFHVLRLLAFTLFLHLPIVLTASAWTLRRHAKRSSRACWTAALALVGVALYAFVIEPRALEVRSVRIVSPKLERPLRVAVIADLQTDGIGAHERRALMQVRDAHPDLIVMPGDFVHDHDDEHRLQVIADLRALFEEIDLSPRLGIFATGGNCDRPGWERIFDGLPVTAWTTTSSSDLGELRLTGLDLWNSFNTRLNVPASDRFHLVFGHAPDFALGSVEADLLIAGHTHGGQVQLPWIGPLVTLSRVPRAWASGVTHLDADRTLVVSRGIGMERGKAPRLRFLCRPEIVVIDIVPGD